jgi:hypothetical protein
MPGLSEWFYREMKLRFRFYLKDQIGQFYNLTGEIKNKGKTALTISFALALVKNQE